MGDVIDLFSKRQKTTKIPDKNTEVQESFEAAIAKNEANAERMKAERIKSTKKVLKDYKIK